MSSLDSLYDAMGRKKYHVTTFSTIVINASSDHSPTSDATRLMSVYVGHSLLLCFQALNLFGVKLRLALTR